MSNEKAKQQQQGTEWVEFKETSLDDIPPKLDQRRGNAEKVPKIDPLSLNEVPLHDDDKSHVDIPKIENAKSNGVSYSTPSKQKLSTDMANGNNGIAEIQITRHEQNTVTPTKKSSKDSTSWTNSTGNLPNNKSNEVIMGVSSSSQGDEQPQDFQNGKVITSVYPTNEHCAWLSPPEYDPAKMPKILSHAQIRLPPSTYVEVMKAITSDIRFNSYCILYSRVLPVWILLSVIVLLIVLFSSPSGGLPVMVFTCIWMFMLLLGIFFCIIIRNHLAIALRQSVKDANKLALPYKLMVGVQDRGQLSCHKIVILFLYYEINGCHEDVARLLRVRQANQVPGQSLSALRSVRLTDAEVEDMSYQLLLKYSQQYVKAYMKKQLIFPTRPVEGVSDFRPKHCAKSECICQFIEKEHFDKKHQTWFQKLV